ncbi:site-specific integrase [Acidithiobacillus montserratensis]|uniref:Site-specific integrase n=1 Tax=Acidithiobacillus montserratensis TaxID=2729135 RepID=A0ACD5HFK8_9PROT|nr:site-specific integrase [Acidithiobacillus montserratensis]MBN2680050.1 site-specific integrase [Acidithiobacillaceae bacterium]MBU2749073.1 site-specific integrase [Acidithiobacillus montserratensis]
MTELRARGRASATIQQALRSLTFLHLFMDCHDVDLDQRLEEGRLLGLAEVDGLLRVCGLTLEAAVSEGWPTLNSGTVLGCDAKRCKAKSPDRSTIAIRIGYIREYLTWRVTYRLLHGMSSPDAYLNLKSVGELVNKALKARAPTPSTRNTFGIRMGLAAVDKAYLLSVISPVSTDNPWVSAHTKVRNNLMVQYLLFLGIRRGELLGIRVSDLDFQKNEVLVARRADAPEDPRAAQPNAKTADRLLPLDQELSDLTRNYILTWRRRFKGARRHPFLFVASGTGDPLTLSAINRVFETLRVKCPSLPANLSPHVLRHTWNDEFSLMMDANKVDAELEKKMRSRLMGWSEHSNTAATYTRRHIQRKANEALLGMQRNLTKGGPDEI